MARRARLSQAPVRAARRSGRGRPGRRTGGLRCAGGSDRHAHDRRRARSRGGAGGVTTAAQEAPAPGKRARPLWRRMLVWAVIVIVIGAAADLLGWDIRGWFHDLWHTMTTISVGSMIAAIALMILQPTATAFAWYSILRYAYPERTKWKDILAGYAVSVGLNTILPANLGTLVFLIMLTTFLSISFAAVLGAYAV